MKKLLLLGFLFMLSCDNNDNVAPLLGDGGLGSGDLSDDKFSVSTINNVLTVKGECISGGSFLDREINVRVIGVDNNIMRIGDVSQYVDGDFFNDLRKAFTLNFTDNKEMQNGLNIYLVHFVGLQDKLKMEKNYEYFYGADDLHLQNLSIPLKLVERYKETVCTRGTKCDEFNHAYGNPEIITSVAGFLTYSSDQVGAAYCFLPKRAMNKNSGDDKVSDRYIEHLGEVVYQEQLKECFLRAVGYVGVIDRGSDYKTFFGAAPYENKLKKLSTWPDGLVNVPECIKNRWSNE